MSDTGAGDGGDNSDNTALFYKYDPSHYMGQGKGEDTLDRVLSSVYEQPSTDKIEGNINIKILHEMRVHSLSQCQYCQWFISSTSCIFSVTAYDHQQQYEQGPYYPFGNQDYLLNAHLDEEEKENEDFQLHPLNLHADQKGWS